MTDQPIAQVLCEKCLTAHVAYTTDELKALERCPVCDTRIMQFIEGDSGTFEVTE